MFCFRGCSFVSKTKTVESHGAIAVFITDKLQYVNGEPLVDMIHDGTARDVHIPAGFMLGSDGYIYFHFYMILSCLLVVSRKQPSQNNHVVQCDADLGPVYTLSLVQIFVSLCTCVR